MLLFFQPFLTSSLFKLVKEKKIKNIGIYRTNRAIRVTHKIWVSTSSTLPVDAVERKYLNKMARLLAITFFAESLN